MILRRILVFALLCVTGEIYARMYQWTEPDVGTTQLSGKPPAWYRSGKDGPRVFVFDNGRLIDDTGVRVSDDVRQRMRQQAFLLVEENKQNAQKKIAKSQKLKQEYEEPESGESDIDSIVKDELNPALISDDQVINESSDAPEEKARNEPNKNIEELREMIVEWEKTQTENAKKALDQ